MQVVGQVDVGKSTLCKILLNYAIRRDCAPTMIDLDLGTLAFEVPLLNVHQCSYMP